MAEYTRRAVTTTRIEYALPNPTNWAEYAKALAGIKQELSGRALHDDSITLSSNDDEIVLSYEVTS